MIVTQRLRLLIELSLSRMVPKAELSSRHLLSSGHVVLLGLQEFQELLVL
jgi:hypothetical protein